MNEGEMRKMQKEFEEKSTTELLQSDNIITRMAVLSEAVLAFLEEYQEENDVILDNLDLLALPYFLEEGLLGHLQVPIDIKKAQKTNDKLCRAIRMSPTKNSFDIMWAIARTGSDYLNMMDMVKRGIDKS